MLNTIIQKTKRDVLALSLLMFFPLLPVSKIPILLYLVIIYVITFNKKVIVNNFTKENFTMYLYLQLWIVFSLITFFYTEDVNRYYKIILRYLPFIFGTFFILFGFKKITKTNINNLFKVLIVCLLIKFFIVYLGIVQGSNHFYNENFSAFNFIDNIKRFLNHTPNQLIGNYKWQPNRPVLFFHKAYTSILLVISITYVLIGLKNTKKLYKKVIGLIILILFNLFLLFLFSVPNILILCLIYLIFVIKSFNNSLPLLLGISILVISSVAIYAYSSGGKAYLGTQQQKLTTYVKSLKKQINDPNSNVINNSRIRSATCALTNINMSPFFGVGEGDVKQILLDCYKERGFLTQLKEEHNTHNYYLNRLLSGGIIMLILFLIMFFTLFRVAYKNKDYLFLVILFVFLFNLLFENIFSVAFGVFSFAFITSICLKFNLSNSKGDLL